MKTEKLNRDNYISPTDELILKQLAGEIAKLASRPIEQEKKKLWYAKNSLEPVRPLIFCDPENGWNEIITEKHLECQGVLARQWEKGLRKEIFWGQSMNDDKVIEPVFKVNYVFTESDWGMHETQIRTQSSGSYHWDPPLKEYGDLNKLHWPKITVDYQATEKTLELACRTFGDILQVQLKGIWWWTLGMTWTLINLRGLDQFMMDMYDHRDELHQLMSILRDGHLAKLDYLQENQLLSLNNDNTYVGSGGFGFSKELPAEDFNGKHVRTQDMWGFCESQETSSVSPEMFEEYIFPYQLTIMERFGLNCYGCCEPLHTRWPIIKRYPHLRRVSISPWSDWEKMAEYLQDKYIYSLKPNPTDIATREIDEERIRRDLRRVLDITRSCRVEIIMKDNHTIGNNPQNVVRWCQIAREEAERLSC